MSTGIFKPGFINVMLEARNRINQTLARTHKHKAHTLPGAVRAKESTVTAIDRFDEMTGDLIDAFGTEKAAFDLWQLSFDVEMLPNRASFEEVAAFAEKGYKELLSKS